MRIKDLFYVLALIIGMGSIVINLQIGLYIFLYGSITWVEPNLVILTIEIILLLFSLIFLWDLTFKFVKYLIDDSV